jgi:hypothetical protein
MFLLISLVLLLGFGMVLVLGLLSVLDALLSSSCHPSLSMPDTYPESDHGGASPSPSEPRLHRSLDGYRCQYSTRHLKRVGRDCNS